MADSPLLSSEGVFEFHLFCDGKELSSEYALLSADIDFRLNSVPRATLIIEDGSMPEGKFPLSDSDLLKPGCTVKVTAGYALKPVAVFTGVVVRHGVSIGRDGVSSLKVECRDKAIALTCGRRNANFLNKSDDDVIKGIAGKYGLSVSSAMGSAVHKELLQYYCSDWDFILTRAEVNGCWVRIKDGKVFVEKIKPYGSAEVSLTWGTDIIRFKADADASYQMKKVKARAWDLAKLDVASADASSDSFIKQGNLDGGTLAKALSLEDSVLQAGIPLATDSLKAWAVAEQAKNELSRIRGAVTCIGTPKVEIGGVVELHGVGDRFNGSALVSGVSHHMKAGRWETDINFGMDKEWFVESFRTEAPLASGLNCGVNGLLPGIVTKLDGDPEKQNRIQVKIPLMQSETEGVWARLGAPYASKGIGNFFLPEIGDEVILGFFNADPSCPVILGSLYSSGRNMPEEIKAENEIKKFISRSKLTVEFDEKKKSISFKTPGERSFVMNDDDKSITVSDKDGNKLVISDKGISMTSPKDISLSAKGKVSIEATGEVSLNSVSGDIKADGKNVKLSAKMSFSAQGNATAELSSSGQAKVKGAMVMIN
ncbi:MAG: type VI secretion system tip protein VgrG [Fibrobacteraceae bacterium]|nr:type VI secretion system tip protein VgrG [Fibrobacteraceae bacterium]